MSSQYTKTYRLPRFFGAMLVISLIILSAGISKSNAQTATEKTHDISVKKLLEEKNTKDTNNQPAKYDGPLDEFERGQPRSAIAGYLRAMRTGDVSLASQYLDYRNLSEKTLNVGKEELARQLSVVLNRTLWVDLHSISVMPEGRQDDGLPSYRELVGHIKYRGRDVAILLQRVPRASDKVKIWKISNATVEKIPSLFKRYSYSPLGEFLAKHLPSIDLFGVMLWQWLYFTAMMLIYYLVAKLFTWSIAFIIKRISSSISDDILRFIKEPVALLIAVILARNFQDESNVTMAVRAVNEGSTLLIIAWCWVCFRLIDLTKTLMGDKFIAQNNRN